MKSRTKFIYSIIVLLLIAQSCFSSERLAKQKIIGNIKAIADSIRPLRVGDRLPDLELNMIRYKKSKVRISDFKGKLLILDFWSIWCGGCINALPKLEKLQQKFPNQLMILPVSFTKTAAEVEAFYKKQAGFNSPIGLASAIYPTMKNDMLKLFPVPGFPLLVWVSGEGKVLAITDSFMATEENIQKILSGESPNLPIAGLYRQMAVSEKEVGKIPKPKTLFSSTIKPYNDTLVNDIFKFQNNADKLSITFNNASIVSLLKASLYTTDVTDFRNKKVHVEFADSSWIFGPKADTSFYKNMAKNSFCYELTAPASLGKKKAFIVMNQQLSAFFGLKSRFEEREVDCLILDEIPGRSVIESKGGKAWIEEGKKHVQYFLHNKNLSTLTSLMQTPRGSPLIFNEVKKEYLIDFSLELSEQNPLEYLNVKLSEIGLELRPARRIVKVVVISKLD
jgi:thiol-disulfide isomerase/thioredoxin